MTWSAVLAGSRLTNLADIFISQFRSNRHLLAIIRFWKRSIHGVVRSRLCSVTGRAVRPSRLCELSHVPLSVCASWGGDSTSEKRPWRYVDTKLFTISLDPCYFQMPEKGMAVVVVVKEGTSTSEGHSHCSRCGLFWKHPNINPLLLALSIIHLGSERVFGLLCF